MNFRMVSYLLRAEHALNSLWHSSFWRISLLCEFSEMHCGESLPKGFPHLAFWLYSKLSSSVLCSVTHLCCYDKIPGYCSLREEGCVLACGFRVHSPPKQGRHAGRQLHSGGNLWLGLLNSSLLSASGSRERRWQLPFLPFFFFLNFVFILRS